jgi:predicted RNA-binding protein (virulence factor B family)
MALIGQRNLLPVLRSAPPGYYLDGGSHGEILLPGRYIPKGVIPGGIMDVFVYRDSEDRLVASTETPHAQVGEFALLRIVSINPRVGVFLDWGLEKDLLLPRREQTKPLRAGDWVLVRIALDEKTDRIVASTRLNRYLDLTPPTYAEGQAVKLLVVDATPLGFNVIVEHAHRGLIYHTDLAAPLTAGQPIEGFVRAVRPDGKIDVALDRAGYRRIAPLTEQIMEALKDNDGHLPYHDGSSPEEIREVFGVSKKAFKQAIGSLYRDRKIEIHPEGIRFPSSGQNTKRS